jgi:hypothetical protein
MRQMLAICALCALSVTACEKQEAPRAVTTAPKPAPPSALCTDWLKDAMSLGKAEEAAGKSEVGMYYFFAARCVHEKAFLLATGTDTAETISGAATDLCQGEILQWEGRASGFNDQADASTASGSKKLAVLEVLRARAGHCPAPKETSN